MPKQHRIRQWSEQGTTRSGKKVQVFRWECWGPNCTRDGRPATGTTTLFQTKRDIEIRAHRES